MLRQLQFIIISFLLFGSLSAVADGNFYIRGKILSRPGDREWRKMVYMARVADLNDVYRTSYSMLADSAVIAPDGSFLFHHAALIEDNHFYRLEVYKKGRPGTTMLIAYGIDDNYAFLLLRKNSKIEFRTEIAHFNYAFAPVRLDAANRSFRKVYDLGRPTQEAIQPLVEKRMLLEAQNEPPPPDTIKALNGRIMDLSNDLCLRMMPVIDTLSNPYVALFTFLTHYSDDSLFCLKLNSRLQREIPKSPYAGQFLESIYDRLYTLPIGSEAPEIALPDSAGHIRRLSEFRGKCVLVDFWASWCHPCRLENQEFIKPLISRLPDARFKVFSVSMDAQRDKWVKAIRDDQLWWTEVCDLLGADSPAARQYRVTDVPVTYVIGPDGRILAKNLHGKALDDCITRVASGK